MEKLLQQMLETEINLDYLTGLINRRGLAEIWEKLPADTIVHCVYLDVDNFKWVNDIYGHSKGDELLVFVSNLLKDIFKGQVVVRLGGDEFCVLCDGELSAQEIEPKFELLQDALSSGAFDVTIEDVLSFSIGVTWEERISTGMNEVMQHCDDAMYYIKKHGKNNYIAYGEIREQLEEEIEIKEHALAGHISEELEILYSPIIYIQTSDVYAVEVVTQWNLPEKGIIPDSKFTSILKQYGILPLADAYVFTQACLQKKKWKNTKLEHVDIYVKLSSMYLLQRGKIDTMLAFIEENKLNPKEFKICIEEKDFEGKEEQMQSTIKLLQKKGIEIAINNFASASSLIILQKFPSDYLKLDARLVEMAKYTKEALSILRNVISLGRDLKYGIIAQGIENTAQIEMLANYGAQFGKGDFYGKPCTAEEFLETYADRLFLENIKQPVIYPFNKDLADTKLVHQGTFVGEGLSYSQGVVKGQSAIQFPGGGVKENYLCLPNDTIYSDSYSICFWVNPALEQPWTSIFYIEYADGFMSLIPVSGHGDFYFRIKDDREANEWHDIACRQAVPGQWSYICATYDVITRIAKLYFNGLLVGSREKMPNLKVIKKIMVGGDEYQNSYEGKLAGLEIYRYVISAETIEKNFQEYQKQASFLGTDGRK